MLKEILIKLISESDNEILEMTFNRKQLLEKIRNQAESLLEHILNILYFQTYSDWDQTIKDIYEELLKLIENPKHKKMLNKKILWKLLFEEPFLAGDEEETNNLLIKKSKRLEKSKKMKIMHIPTYNEVKDIYNILINELWVKNI